MIKRGRCPECGGLVGEEVGVSPYKHAVNCLHLGQGRPEDLIDRALKTNQVYGERVKALMDMEGATE